LDKNIFDYKFIGLKLGPRYALYNMTWSNGFDYLVKRQ
jgi:hypothetical protein